MIHTTNKKYPLNNQDRAPSLKLAHQDHSTITYETRKQTKTKKQGNKFFNALETPHL